MATNLEAPRFNPAALTAGRVQRGLTQVELAQLLTVHVNMIYRLENGKTPISAANLRHVAQALKITPAQLQHPLPPDPTLADLRTQLALTVPMTAQRLAVRPTRLLLWEKGLLGRADERGELLAAVVGVGIEHIVLYEQTGTLPVSLALRLAKVLRVEDTVVQAAFLASRRIQQAAEETS
ncbi:helix-turn-helix transcriptional regulator [Umezawaea sp. Da 62-37]|uniref:helix-turn-helix domain-containing protein n=1 Tax=Umezawaea sp. Da 62-37 TaxID=3075927 RepID=UPI0028F6CBF0|nr:helix-turn-helix transcriptional regulator [Umezawaea sp. Da 62-37]WNV83170.1 helix-turn-helix transcriptional regulator [Umezawaea sp. Da 62-37]